jgi:hypothetical protein
MLQMKKNTGAKITALIASIATMAVALGLVQRGAAATASADVLAQTAPSAGASQPYATPTKAAAQTKSVQATTRTTTRTHVS